MPAGHTRVSRSMARLAGISSQDALSQTNRLLDAGVNLIKIAMDSESTSDQ